MVPTLRCVDAVWEEGGLGDRRDGACLISRGENIGVSCRLYRPVMSIYYDAALIALIDVVGFFSNMWDAGFCPGQAN